jgi:hypothetical protein
MRPEDIQSWVPTAVQEDVCTWLERYRDHPPDGFAILCRLVTNTEMKHVWNMLGARHRKRAALKEFFFTAYDAACHPRLVTTKKELLRKAEEFSAAANIVRWINEQEADELCRAAQAMRARSRQYGADLPVMLTPDGWRPPKLIVVLRDEGQANNAARAYVLELSNLTHRLFGGPLRKVIAINATVALQRPISESQVRKWTS